MKKLITWQNRKTPRSARSLWRCSIIFWYIWQRCHCKIVGLSVDWYAGDDEALYKRVFDEILQLLWDFTQNMWSSFWSFSHLTIWVTFCRSEIRKEMRRTAVAVLQPTNAFRGKIENSLWNISTKQTPEEGPQVFSLKYGALSSIKLKEITTIFSKIYTTLYFAMSFK